MESKKDPIIIITGASSGLGAEFARQLAAKTSGAVFWLVARREGRLRELANELHQGYHADARIFAIDLTDEAALDTFRKTLAEEAPTVSMLIHAAGFGKIGSYREIGRTDALRMIRLNCMAAVDVTESVLPYMAKGSRILEIASTAGFQPFQGLNVYAATKAFLLRYTRGLSVELLGSGIRAIAVCPYWIRDTEFIPVSKETKSSDIRHFPLSSGKKSVAQLSLFAARIGLPVCTPGIVCTVHRLFSFLPDTVLQLIWAGLRRV